MPPESTRDTVPPVGQAVLPHEKSIDPRYRKDRRRKTPLPDMPMRAASRIGQAYKSVLDANGGLRNYPCPECVKHHRVGVIRYRRVPGNLSPVAECDNPRCTWTVSQMTSEERTELAKADPEAQLVAHLIAGKDRRNKKFLSECCY